VKAHVEMVRTQPDEIFEVPNGGRVVHVDHTEQGLYVYFYVPHEVLPQPEARRGKGWKA
jgi:hypothetical protein